VELLGAMLLGATAAMVLRVVSRPAPPVSEGGVFAELARRRGLPLVGPRTARGRWGDFELELRADDPKLFLWVELRGGQPDQLRLRGRADAGHPVLRALGPAVRRPVAEALDIDAALRGGGWLLQVWEPLHAVAADRLVQVVVDAAYALARVPAVEMDRAIAAHDPDLTVRRLQVAAAVASGRASLQWLLEVAGHNVPEVAVTAAAAAGEAGRPRLLALLGDPYVAERAALALSHLAPGPEQERVEDLLLSSAETGDLDALDALSRYASVRVVPALHGLVYRSRREPQVLRHARAALDAIRSRAGGPGRLSLVSAGRGGELALISPTAPGPASTP
jgi:hypothetical protein